MRLPILLQLKRSLKPYVNSCPPQTCNAYNWSGEHKFKKYLAIGLNLVDFFSSIFGRRKAYVTAIVRCTNLLLCFYCSSIFLFSYGMFRYKCTVSVSIQDLGLGYLLVQTVIFASTRNMFYMQNAEISIPYIHKASPPPLVLHIRRKNSGTY